MINTTYINGILDDLILNTSDPLYVGLSTTEPLLDELDPSGFTNITEPAAADYSRAPLYQADWDVAIGRTKTTINDIVFSAPVDAWGVVTHIAVFDQTSGEVIFTSPLIQTVNLTAGGDQLIIPAGTLTITFP